MQRLMRIVALGVFVVLGPGSAAAQQVKHGAPSGLVLSARAETLVTGHDATVLTIPSTGYFILTQACVTQGSASAATNLVGSTIGLIVQSWSEPCTAFTPGIVLNPGEELICHNPGNLLGLTKPACLVTGVVSKK